MTSLDTILDALCAVVATSTGIDCYKMLPTTDAPNLQYLEPDIETDYDYEESGGRAVATHTVYLVTSTLINGATSGDVETFAAIEERLNVIRAAFEADMSIGGIVRTAEIIKAKRTTTRVDAAFETSVRITLEVTER